jgi:hypothetical protein
MYVSSLFVPVEMGELITYNYYIIGLSIVVFSREVSPQVCHPTRAFLRSLEITITCNYVVP